MSKKLLSLVLALVIVLGSFSTVFAASYNDVEAGTTVADAVDRLSTLGILTGYKDGSFKPENQITRAEFAAVAVRAKGLEDAANAAKGLATGFTDVAPAPAHWAAGYVGTAARLGIVNGVGGGLFAPEAPVKYEEAITMIVRALGYEAAAQTKGGYPYGYLIVANEIGLLDQVKGTQGTPATRGIVAQITDNALEIPMMIQVGFGADAKWVVSGSREHGDNAQERYLLDELGFDAVEGRVISVNTKTDKIVVDPTDEDLKNVTLEVAEGFDFYAVEGLEAKFWSKDDVVVIYVVQEEAKYDAVKVDKDELTLVVEDENYEVARNAKLVLDGKDVKQDKFNADYAKVVLNDDDEIIWAQGYTFDGFILVEEVEGNIALSYDDYDEVNLKDFTVVKEGKTIGIAGIEEEDILFFNNDEDFAVVANKGTEGELDRVYADATFRFEGSAYALSEISTVLYFDEGKVGELDAEILDEFLDDEATIEVFVDFAGDVVVVKGEVSSVGNSSYGVLLKTPVEYAGRKGSMIALDVRNGANAKVSYDIEVADLGKDVKLTNIRLTTDKKGLEDLRGNKIEEDTVLKISVDKDGDVTAIELLESFIAKSFKIDDSNAKVKADDTSYKLQSSTIVFHDDNDKATTLGNAKDVFKEVKVDSTIYVEKGRVVAVVGETDTDADTKTISALVTGVKFLTSGKLEFTTKVFGATQRIFTEAKNFNSTDATYYSNLFKDKIVTFKVGETSEEIKNIADVKETSKRAITVKSISGRTINAETGSAVELNTKAVIYDAADDFETLAIRDLKKDMVVTVYFQGSSNRFVDYVVVGSQGAGPVVPTGVVTYINAAGTRFEVDGVVYTVNEDTVLKENNTTIAIGIVAIKAKLVEGDKVTVKDNVITRTFSKALADAQQALADANALVVGVTQAAKDQALADANALVVGVTQAAKNQALADAEALVVGVTQAAKNQAIVDAYSLVVGEGEGEVTQAAKDQAIADANALVIGVTQAAKDQAIADANALVVGVTQAAKDQAIADAEAALEALE